MPGRERHHQNVVAKGQKQEGGIEDPQDQQSESAETDEDGKQVSGKRMHPSGALVPLSRGFKLFPPEC